MSADVMSPAAALALYEAAQENAARARQAAADAAQVAADADWVAAELQTAMELSVPCAWHSVPAGVVCPPVSRCSRLEAAVRAAGGAR